MPDWCEIKEHFKNTYSVLFAPVTVFIWGAATVVAVLAGPFGTYEAMGWPVRAAFWIAIVTSAIVIGFAVRATAVALIGPRRPLLFDIFAAALMTAVYSPLVWLLRNWVGHVPTGPMTHFDAIAVNVFVIAGGVFVLRRQLSIEKPGSYRPPDSSAEPADAPRLRRRLSAADGDILRLSGKNHCVEVVTDHGRETLRLRLTDAIAEMEPVEGFYAHRSHWVARSAIVTVKRENARKVFLVLRNGDHVPVSRKYRPQIEKVGILR